MSENALLPIVHKYFEKDPIAAAHTLETVDEDQALEILKAVPPKMAGEAVKHLPAGFAALLMQRLPYPQFNEIVEELDPQQGAAIFFHFPEHVRQLFILQLAEKKKMLIQEILTFPEGSAGRIMTSDFLALHKDLKVKDAIRKIRLLARQGAKTSYSYVVDEDDVLVGVLNMRDLMLATEDETLGNIMRTNIFTIDSFMDREQIASELSKGRYFAAPVVDGQNHLLGVVKAEDLIEDVQEEATEDIQKMFGAGGDERTFSPLSFSLKKRLPWLHVNLVTAFMAAAVVAFFEDIIAKITILAVFLPVVAGQGGNAGAQSLAVVMRGLVMREIPKRKASKLVIKEMLVGVIGGVVIGVVTAVIAYLWYGNPYLGLVIGLGMVVNLTIASFSGAVIPLGMKALGMDPAQCSNIILTTITDVMGFLAFLGFAVLFQDYLV